MWRAGRAIALCGALLGCSAYDAKLLGPATSIGGSSGPIAASGGRPSSGSGGAPSFDAGTAKTFVGTGDAGVDAGSDASGTRCGDGVVSGSEKCDIGLQSGASGACPSACPPLGTCTPRALNGSGCQAECVVLQADCTPGDGCCPGTCTAATDSDCSTSCGDGVVQKDKGETCEPASTTAPCPTLADCDDKDACTTDMLTGSAANCSAACVHAVIDTPKDGDGCCPSGANANTDKDCPPKCGNGIHEPGEECDGGMGCDANCHLTLTQPQMDCLNQFAKDDCERCACINCTAQVDACRNSANATQNTQCLNVISCARANKCVGTPCYCGTDPLCGVGSTGPQGPCKTQVEAACGANPGDVFTVQARTNDTNYPLGRANAVAMCTQTQCTTVCP